MLFVPNVLYFPSLPGSEKDVDLSIVISASKSLVNVPKKMKIIRVLFWRWLNEKVRVFEVVKRLKTVKIDANASTCICDPFSIVTKHRFDLESLFWIC